MKRVVALALSCALLLAGCTTTAAPPPAPPTGPTLEEFMAETNAKHSQALNHVVTDLSPYQREFPRELIKEAGFSEEELAALVSYDRVYSSRATLSAEQAAQDIDVLFRLFYYCFAQYEYYGGQEVFDKARQAIEAELAGKSYVMAKDLEEILRTHLAFITDGHSMLNDRLFSPRQRYYSSEKVALLPDESGGYTALLDGGTERLVSVNGSEDVGSWLLPSISAEGALVWFPGVLALSGGAPIEAVFQFEKTAVTLSLTESQPYTGYDPSIPFSESWEGVPTVALRQFTDRDANSAFIKTGAPLAEQPVAILDLRGNSGGLISVGATWLHAYGCGSLAPFRDNDSSISLKTRALSYISVHDSPSRLSWLLTTPAQKFYENEMRFYNRQGNGCTLLRPIMLVQAEAEGTLFVLLDAEVASSGEHLTAALTGRTNTVFVGTTTSGALIGDTGIRTVLPHSALTVNLSATLFLYYDETIFDETIGFQPDLWVSGDSLARVQALINHYEP